MFAIFFTAIVFIMTNESASLSRESKGCYYSLNSIIAKESSSAVKRWSLNVIPKEAKMKIINLIERLAQTSITVWCLDLFPLNNYELYLFIASVSSNFFLFVGLLEK